MLGSLPERGDDFDTNAILEGIDGFLRSRSNQTTSSSDRPQTPQVATPDSGYRFSKETKKSLDKLNCWYVTLRGQSAADLREIGYLCRLAGPELASNSGLRLPSWRSEIAIYPDHARFLPKEIAGWDLNYQLNYIDDQNKRLSNEIPGAKLVAGGLPECLWVEYIVRVTNPNIRLFDLGTGYLGTSTTTTFRDQQNFALWRDKREEPMLIQVMKNEEGRPPWLSMAGFFVPKDLPVR